ncbi:hypothetical protein ES703_100331 [subsurface metagenome]
MGGEVMQQRATAGAGLQLHRQRGRAGDAELDQAADRGIQQPLPHRGGIPVGPGSRLALGHYPSS